MNQFSKWFNQRWSFYQPRYWAWWLVARAVHFLVAGFCSVLVQALAITLTTGKFEDPLAVLKRFIRIENSVISLNTPSLEDSIILGALFVSLAVVLGWWWKYFSDFAVLMTFRPLSSNLQAQSKALTVLFSSLLDAPRPKHITPQRHDSNLNKIKLECATSVLSARAFFEMKVDPEDIELCFRELLKKSTNSSPLGGICRIVACSTLTPKEWLNSPVVSYLMTTLGLEPTRGLSTTAHKCRYFYLGSQVEDDHDKVILTFLAAIHKMFGFSFTQVDDTRLTPIFEYQREKYGVANPDPAFLFIEGTSEVLFYRIVFSTEHRGPFTKKWASETWNLHNNKSVNAYKRVIDTLCPPPNI